MGLLLRVQRHRRSSAEIALKPQKRRSYQRIGSSQKQGIQLRFRFPERYPKHCVLFVRLSFKLRAIEKGGKYKDLNVRFNAALMNNYRYVNGAFEENYGTWQVRRQLPTKALTKYKLQCPNKKAQTLMLPWIVFAPESNYNDSASYFARECATRAPASSLDQFPETLGIPTQDSRSLLGEAGPAHVPHRHNFNSHYTSITSDEMFLFGYLSKGKGVAHKTGIIHIDTFAPENITLSALTLYEGLSKFKKLGIEKIILDVQNNGGELFKFISSCAK
ncbi:hypothetical protein BC938DRAFT_478581 [Jimgerdemannia flammicorona]|uniref:Tail specific protease domain-containing protein n=1 Tax=Jimgerdemannia flammicorona TaxID=994334 RepID=A0A433QMM1_9FUNG|nr:hypothetical protein BC938DRAFT_478581 [Jimgerdemannia flammicorona]